MEIPDNLLNYIKEQANKVHHGRITIEINDTAHKMDVVVESRERFFGKEKVEGNSPKPLNKKN